MNIETHMSKPQRAVVPGVKHLIAVASGKGGVGKSTTSVNLALALRQEGARVGLLDADIHGPNQPKMLGTEQLPERVGQGLKPVEAHGLQTMSIGYVVDEQTPMVWRGPMVSKVMEQLLRETQWDNLDYLVIDLPPGTGDVQLTLSKRFRVNGVVLVTTPQDVALLDVRKALEMFKKVDVPVIGVIENMSTHVCSECGHEEALFGQGGGERLAAQNDLMLLGRLPLDITIREACDAGKPTVIASPDSAVTAIYRGIARAVMHEMSKKSRLAFPEIVVE